MGNKKDDLKTGVNCEQILGDETKKVFGIGEHIISIPISADFRKSNMQYEYYQGYKPVGIGGSVYTKIDNKFGGGFITYANIVEVESVASSIDQNNILIYTNFGKPLENVNDINNSTPEVKDFEVGEHIISIPLTFDPRKGNMQYTFFEGYDIVGVDITTYGDFNNIFGGGCLLYVNTQPVRCQISYLDNNEKGVYINFGKPIVLEDALTKTLK